MRAQILGFVLPPSQYSRAPELPVKISIARGGPHPLRKLLQFRLRLGSPICDEGCASNWAACGDTKADVAGSMVLTPSYAVRRSRTSRPIDDTEC